MFPYSFVIPFGTGAGLPTGVTTARKINTANSVIGGGDLTTDRTLQLSGDVASPGANQVYGTDGGGVRGWVPQSSAEVPLTRNVSTTNSITGGGDLSADRTLKLVGDTASPGTSYLYGTDGSGTRGWFPQAGTPALPNTGTYATLQARTPSGAGDMVFVRGRAADRDGGEGAFVYNASPVGAAMVTVQSAGSGYSVMPGRGVIVNADGKGTNISYFVKDNGTIGAAWIDQVAAGSAYTTDTIDVTIPDTKAVLTIDPCTKRAVVGDQVKITISAVDTIFTFVASGATGTQVNLGTTVGTDQSNLVSVINANLSASITAVTVSGQNTSVTQLTAVTAGTAFNSNSVTITQTDDVHPWRLTNAARAQQLTSSSPSTLNFGGGGTGGVVRCYRDNGGSHIVPSAGSEPRGRWERSIEGRPLWCDARWFGLSISNSDNTAAIQAADGCSWLFNNTIYLPGAGGNSQSQGANFNCSGQLILSSAIVADCIINSSYSVQNESCVIITHPKISRGPRGFGLSVTSTRNPGAVIDDGAALEIILATYADVDIGYQTGTHITTGVRYTCFDPRNVPTGSSSQYFFKSECRLAQGNRHSVHVTQTYIQRSVDDGSSMREGFLWFREVNGTTQSVTGKFTYYCQEAPGARLPCTSVGPKFDSNDIFLGDLETSSVTADEFHAAEVYVGTGNTIKCNRFDVGPNQSTNNTQRIQAFGLLYVSPRDGDCNNNVFDASPDLVATISNNIRTGSNINTLWIEPSDPSIQPQIKRFDGCAVRTTDYRVPYVHAFDVSFKNNIIGWGTSALPHLVIPGMFSSTDGYLGRVYTITPRYGFVNIFASTGQGPLAGPFVKVPTDAHKTFQYAVKFPQVGSKSITDTTNRPSASQIICMLFDFRGRVIPSGGTSGAASGGYANARVFADGLNLAVDDVIVTQISLRVFVWRCITPGVTDIAQVPTYPNPIQTSGTATLEFCGIQGADISAAGLTFNQSGMLHGLPASGTVTFSNRVAEVWFVVIGGVASGLYVCPLDTSYKDPFQVIPPPKYDGWMPSPPTFGNFALGQRMLNSTLADGSGWTCVTAGWLAYDAYTTTTAYIAGAIVSSGGNVFACIAGAAKRSVTGTASGGNADLVVYDVASLGTATSVTFSSNPPSFTATYDIKRVIPAAPGYSDTIDTIGTVSITVGGTVTLSLSGATPYFYEWQILRFTRTDGNGTYTPTITIHYCGGTTVPTDTVVNSTIDPNTITSQPVDRLVGSDGFVWKSLGGQAVISPNIAGYRTVKVTGTADSPGVGDNSTLRWLTNASAATENLPSIATVGIGYPLVIYQDRTAPNPTITPNGADTVSGAVTWGVNVAYRYEATGATTWTATKVV